MHKNRKSPSLTAEISPAEIKAELLSNGMALSERFIAAYGVPYLEKRRAYGNSDPISYLDMTIPQELYLLPSMVVCSVNVRPDSYFLLDVQDGKFVIVGPRNVQCEVTFPLRPNFYNFSLKNGLPSNAIGTLYGGGALGIFVYGNCSLVLKKQACKYCSIEANRKVQKEFEDVVKPEDVYELVKLALTTDPDVLTQIMINGGNFNNGDKSFSYYIDICAAAREAIDDTKSNVELHLIAYPPQDFSLFHELAKHDVSLAMNTEVFDLEKFQHYCPGKNQVEIISALKVAGEVLGPGKVFSIFVGGLESLETMEKGFEELASYGVTPIINVFHPDPGTSLEYTKAPTVKFIMEMGSLLQNTYRKNTFMRPFYDGCGRNAIDSEASSLLF